jgi:chromosome segregation ATPase
LKFFVNTVKKQEQTIQEYEKKIAEANHVFSYQGSRRLDMERRIQELEQENDHLSRELHSARQQCDLAVNSASTVVSQIVTAVKASNGYIIPLI